MRVELDGSVAEDLVGVGDAVVDERTHLQQTGRDEVDVEDVFEISGESDVLVELDSDDWGKVFSRVAGSEVERIGTCTRGRTSTAKALQRGRSIEVLRAGGQASINIEV